MYREIDSSWHAEPYRACELYACGVLFHDLKFSPPVLGPGAFIVSGLGRLFFTETQGGDILHGNTHGGEIILGC